ESSVADLSPRGTAHRASLADAVGREVVVQQEVAVDVAADGVEALTVALRTQGRRHVGLRLAALEDRRTVRSLVGVRDDPKVADILVTTTVDALAFVEGLRANDLGLELAERGANLVFALG